MSAGSEEVFLQLGEEEENKEGERDVARRKSIQEKIINRS